MIDHDILAMSQSDECVLCGEMFFHATLVSITDGEVQVGAKSGRPVFMANGYPINYIHLHCFQERCNSLKFTISFDDHGGRCGICGDKLEHEHNVFRVTQGFVHGGEFRPVITPDHTILCVELCIECLLSHIGEGDTEMGAMYLGLDQYLLDQ